MNRAHAEAVEAALPEVVANIEEIAEGGNMEAEELILLGNNYYTGFLGQRRLDKAGEFYRRAEALGDGRAFRFVCMTIVENERSSADEVEKALADLDGLYAAGDDNAGVELGKYHAKGNSRIRADWGKALTYFTPLLEKIGAEWAVSGISVELMYIADDIADAYGELGRTRELTPDQQEMLEDIDDKLAML